MSGIFLAGMVDHASSMAAEAAAARQAARSASASRSEINALRDQVERTLLFNQAMWELVSEKLNLTDKDLETKAQEVDLRDGKADGKMSDHPLRCPNCGRVSNSRHKKCLYCGLLFEGSVFGG
mgnify:CR=1 FL=1